MSASVPERWLRMGALGQTDHPGELEWHMAELTLAPVLADLRKQVQALEHRGLVFEGADPPFDLISRTEVLALLDGDTP